MTSPPRFLFVHINQRCNLRCQHCDFWKLNDDDKPNYLSRERMSEILGEFAEMNPDGKVVLCGGEKMLDLDDYFAVTLECRRLGLRAMGVTNGTRIHNPTVAERVIRDGEHEISVSLDSHRPELHDEMRGFQGAFKRAVLALRLLLDARRRLNATGTRIYAIGLVCDLNYLDLEDFYDFVLNEVGADKLKLNFLQPSFGHQGQIDEFFARHHGVDPQRLVEAIDRCDRRFGLGLNPAWRDQVGMYFRSLNADRHIHLGWSSPGGTEVPICNTYERNIMVDHYGFARLCFSPEFPGMQLRQHGDLRRFWQGSDGIRAMMRDCRRYCGISHSVRREPTTLASRTKLAEGG